jgi:hypothetical protein
MQGIYQIANLQCSTSGKLSATQWPEHTPDLFSRDWVTVISTVLEYAGTYFAPQGVRLSGGIAGM